MDLRFKGIYVRLKGLRSSSLHYCDSLCSGITLFTSICSNLFYRLRLSLWYVVIFKGIVRRSSIYFVDDPLFGYLLDNTSIYLEGY